VRPAAKTPRQRFDDARRRLLRGFRRAEQRGAGTRKRALRSARRRLPASR
jgi:hypothetical protein